MLTDANVAEAGVVATLFRASFVETFGALYTAENLARFLAEKSQGVFAAELADPQFAFQIAWQDGEAIGFAKLGPPELPVETPPATIELRQLYVLERATGGGVGAMLMEWARRETRTRQARHLQLSVYTDNHRARRFYQHHGFAEVGQYHFMVGDHADEDVVLRVVL